MNIESDDEINAAIAEALSAVIEAIRRPLLNVEDALAPLREVDQEIYMRIHERIATIEMLLKKEIPEDIRELQPKCWHQEDKNV